MPRTRAKAIFLIAVLAGPLALLAAACSRPAEHQLLNQFFRASRARDNATLAMMSAVTIDPREDGVVENFTITNVSEEQRTPVNLRELVAAEQKARADEAEFSRRKKEYQDANLTAIEQVLKLERTPAARMTPAQQTVKTEWDRWREETTTYTRRVAESRQAVGNSIGPIESSLSQPGSPALNPSEFEGALVTKTVTVDARVASPQGETSNKTLTVTLQRAEGTQAEQNVSGRWIITRVQGL
jgi:hypothetical protein